MANKKTTTKPKSRSKAAASHKKANVKANGFKRSRFSRSTLVIFAAVFALIGGYAIFKSFAFSPAPNIYLNPGSGSYNVGDTLVLSIYEDSGSDQVNAVQANLSYPTSLLTFVSIDGSGSAFGISAQSTGGNGSVQIARGSTTPLTGLQLVAVVRFTAAAGGTADVTWASGTAVVRYTDNQNEPLNMDNGSYTLVAPSNPPPSNPPPSNPPPSNPPSSSTTTTPKTTTKTTTPATTTPTQTTPSQTTPTYPTETSTSSPTNPTPTVASTEKGSNLSFNLGWVAIAGGAIGLFIAVVYLYLSRSHRAIQAGATDIEWAAPQPPPPPVGTGTVIQPNGNALPGSGAGPTLATPGPGSITSPDPTQPPDKTIGH